MENRNDAGKLNTVCKPHKRRATHRLADVRYWGEADMPRPPAPYQSDAIDPNPTPAESRRHVPAQHCLFR
jgi:hypothetical protein